MANEEAPKISIGIPVFNGQQFLEDAFNSLLAQTFDHFEIVIGDNASSDRTAEICEAYRYRFFRFSYYRHAENIGVARNYNFVFGKSNGQFFKWASHDDKIAPTYLEECHDALSDDSSVVVAHSRTVLISGDGREIGVNADDLTLVHPKAYKRVQKLFRNVNLCNPILGLIRSDTLRKSKLIGSFIGSDFVLLLELCMLGKILELDEPLFFRRDHSKNVRKLSPEERARWFDTNYHGRSHRYPTMALLVELLRAIQSSPIERSSKIMCRLQVYFWLKRKLRSNLGLLKKDVMLAIGRS